MSLERRAYCREGIHGEPKPFVEQLPDGYAMHMHRAGGFKGIMLDTFDGHLRHAGQLLVQAPKKLCLLDLVGGGIIEQAANPGWAFAGKLPAGIVADRLLRMSELRAFTEICSVAVEQHGIVVMDELEKTVVRGQATILSHERAHVTLVSPEPLRGYVADLALFANTLGALGFAPFETATNVYAMIGVHIEPYTSKPDVVLEWDAAVHESANRIAAACIGVARRNEDGIAKDIDTEFLHDFRVSLRRVRSLLSLFINVYGEQDCRAVKDELAGIMRQTNRLRDLDVYLMDRGRFYALVPDSMHAGLDALFDVFARERRTACEQVREFLLGDAYCDAMSDLQRRFRAPDGMACGDAANEATGHFARRMIMKRYGKVAKLARSITKTTPDTTVHALRIQCKKLRYLMEFFAPLYAAEDVKPLVKSLKGLQDGLGHFNDCSVQRAALSAFVDEHPMRGRQGLMLAESVGALVATLYQMQLRARLEIDAALGVFANDPTNQCFKAVFAGGESP